MFCHKCGARMPEDSVFCPKCGIPVPGLNDSAVPPAGAQTTPSTVPPAVQAGRMPQPQAMQQTHYGPNPTAPMYLPPIQSYETSSGTSPSDDSSSNPHWWGNGGDNPQRKTKKTDFSLSSRTATKSPHRKRNAVIDAIFVAAAIAAIVAVAFFIDPYHQSSNDSPHTSESDSSDTGTQSNDDTGDSSTTGDGSVIDSILNECPSADETTSLTSSSGFNPSSIDGQSYALLSFHNDNNASAGLGPVLTCVARETGTTSNAGDAINDTLKLYMDLFNIGMKNPNVTNPNDMPAYSVGDGSVSARCSLNMQSMWTVCALTSSGSDDSSSSDE